MAQVLGVLGFLLGWVVAQVQAWEAKKVLERELQQERVLVEELGAGLGQVLESEKALESELKKAQDRASYLESELDFARSQLMYRKD